MVRKQKTSPPLATVGASLPGGSSMANFSSVPASSAVDDEGPDPRWPSLHRWATRITPATPKQASAAPTITGNRALFSSAPPKMVNDDPPPPAQLHGKEPSAIDSAKTINTAAQTSLNVRAVTGLSSPPCLNSAQSIGIPMTATSFPGKGTSVSILNEPEVQGVLGPSTATPLKGAWGKKLNIQSQNASPSQQGGIQGEVSRWPSLSEAREICSQKGHNTKAFEPKAMEDSQRFPWAAKMNPASRNLYRAAEPEYLEDGTPKVSIPPEVMLQGIENQKDYILGQFYRCSSPSGGLVYAVFNKLWGRNCRITIRKLSDSTYLFHVPDESTRKWVLQRGLWHVDDCLMFVAPWTPEASLEIPEIKTIPVWVTLKKIPNILYSIPGSSHIASGLGAPMATHKPRLDPINMGEAKILVEVELSKPFPTRIAAGDESGFISMVDVFYAWLPGTCSRCGQLGHKPKRCLQPEDNPATIVDTQILETTTPPNSVHQTSADHSTDRCIEKSGKSQPCAEGLSAKATTSTDADPITGSTSTSLTKNKENANSTQVSTEIPLGVGIRRTLSSGALEGNRFSSLVSSDEEESSEEEESSDKEVSSGEEENVDTNVDPDPTDILTPAGKRILRERPVQQTTKAKEMQWHPVGGGRGNRGRTNRRGRGRARG